MTGFDAHRSAAAFAALRRAGKPARRLPDDVNPSTVEQGYAVQSALCQVLEVDKGNGCGYKIGCTTPVMQSFLNINHPCAGRLYEREVHDQTAGLRLTDFVAVGVECEIALRLSRDLMPQDTPHSQASVAAAVGQVMAAAEIVDNRYVDFHDFGVPGLIADDFFSAGAVLGPAMPPQGLDLTVAAGRTLIDGTEAGAGLGRSVMGHPYAALAWLANLRAGHGKSLRAGDVVMTGSVVETKWITEPCTVVCEVAPLGEVRISFI